MGIGDKSILNPGFRIGIRDQPERCFNAFELDGLVVGYTRAFSPCPFEQVLDISVALEPGDKVDRIYGEFFVPGVIGKATVKADKGTFGKFERFGPVDLMHFTGSHVDKCGDIAICVQSHVQLDGTFFLAKLGPGEHGQTKIDHGCNQEIEFALE